MTILVTGANGQLGNCMRLLAARGGDRYIFTDVSTADGLETAPLDITDMDAVRRIWTSPTARRYAARCATSTRTSS